MQIFPVGAESLGVRSFSVFVHTKDVNIFIDPSVSLAPTRYRLPPHEIELAVCWQIRQNIMALSRYTDVIALTHYHADHFSLNQVRYYEFTNPHIFRELHIGKHILAKSLRKISRNQQLRAQSLLRDKSFSIEEADGQTFTFGETTLTFSQPLFHGIASPMGTVLALKIEADGETFCFSSDVNGPGTDEALNFLLNTKADVLFLDGPSTYHPNVTQEEVQSALTRLDRLLETETRLVIDHHFLRDLKWQDYVDSSRLETAADFIGLEPAFLEANRKNLFKEEPLPKQYHQELEQGSLDILNSIQKRAKTLPLALKLRDKTHNLLKQLDTSSS
ncbi:MAG: MBL fold metallo-hydrolase [Promethearchaeota archaeon]